MCRDLIVQGLTPCKSAGIIASTDNFVRYVYRRSQDGLTGRKSLQINIGEEAAFITAQPLLLVCIRRPIASITAWCATVHASTQPQLRHGAQQSTPAHNPKPVITARTVCNRGKGLPRRNGRRWATGGWPRGRRKHTHTQRQAARQAGAKGNGADAQPQGKHGVFDEQTRRI